MGTRLLGLLLVACTILCMGPTAAWSGQAQVLEPAIAETASARIYPGAALRHYCPPCGDTHWKPIVVKTISRDASAVQGMYEVVVNGDPIDLAYTYVESANGWTNLAMDLGIVVEEVPRLLGPWLQGPLPDFDVVHYAGWIDGSIPIYMAIEHQHGRLTGSYHYAKVGEAIEIEGNSDAIGNFTMEERAGGELTGVFEGLFGPLGARVKGTWRSPDGQKTLDFLAVKIAMRGMAKAEWRLGGMAAETDSAYPMFFGEFDSWTDYLNREVASTVLSMRQDFVAGFLVDAPNFVSSGGPLSASMQNHAFSIPGYHLAWYSDRFLSMRFDVYSYSGGAHGMTWPVCLNVRPSGGDGARRIGLADLFASGVDYAEVLSPILLEDLRKQEAAFVVDGMVDALAASDLSEFTVNPAGITFYFAPYAVGPYAQGGFTSEVAFDHVTDILRAEVRDSWLDWDIKPAP